MSTVIVTGGAGFIGSYIAHRLASRGDHVVIYDIKPPSAESQSVLDPVAQQVTFVRGRVDDFEETITAFQTHQPTKLVHVAAIVDPDFLARQPLDAFKVNVGGTVNALEAARRTGIERVVYFSSITVLTTRQYEPIDAAHPVILPRSGPSASFYGAAKLSGEAFCFAYEESFGIDFTVLRPSAVYGFGMQWPLSLKPMVDSALAGTPIHLDHGAEFYRDYTYCKDVVQLTERALDAPASRSRDKIFYAATGRLPITTAELARAVTDVIPSAEITVGEGLTEAERADLQYRGRSSIENARTQLGYEPEYAEIRAGIADYVDMQRRFTAGLTDPK
jgi:UDP-glucose 4-epimerase